MVGLLEQASQSCKQIFDQVEMITRGKCLSLFAGSVGDKECLYSILAACVSAIQTSFFVTETLENEK